MNQMVANGFRLLARALRCAIHCGAQVSVSRECRKCYCITGCVLWQLQVTINLYITNSIFKLKK